MEASKMLAERAQQSAAKMEVMTERMHDIAIKTKQETVSMRIITLVTLFFLPGTFISVSRHSPQAVEASTDNHDRH
jgi:Mg2+ and Co2+ transporter CorA